MSRIWSAVLCQTNGLGSSFQLTIQVRLKDLPLPQLSTTPAARRPGCAIAASHRRSRRQDSRSTPKTIRTTDSGDQALTIL